MKSFKPSFAVLIALLLLLIGVGCGSSDSSSSTSSSDSGEASAPLTKAEFIAQGDVLCKKVDAEKAADARAFVKETQGNLKQSLSAEKQQEFALDVALPPIRQLAEELNDLGVPDEPKAAEIVEGIEKASDEAEAEVKEGEAQADPFVVVAKEADAYGFKFCLKGY
jgi:major membrane immunogen (membrane-anchored lipoprotein)